MRLQQLGREAVRLRFNSSRNVVRECEILSTGFSEPGNGEGVYIGEHALGREHEHVREHVHEHAREH